MDTKSILKWALVLSIVVVLNLFFNFAIDSFYDSPDYNDYCGNQSEPVVNVPRNQEQCVADGGQWTENAGKPMPESVIRENTEPAGWCDIDFTCRKEYEEAQSLYNRNVFVGLVITGLVALVIGLFVSATGSAVSLGLSLGGLLSLVIASIRYWSDMDEYLRVIVLGLALIALIWIGIKKFKE